MSTTDLNKCNKQKRQRRMAVNFRNYAIHESFVGRCNHAGDCQSEEYHLTGCPKLAADLVRFKVDRAMFYGERS